jgi:phosphoribosylamine--glycine ligase
VFHAGTRRDGDALLVAGGRVLNMSAVASDISAARERAYEAAGLIRFDGMQLRSDIGEVAARV